MEKYQKHLTGHALLVTIVALLAGFMLAFGLIGGMEILPWFFLELPVYGTADGWARAHTGGITNGLLMIAVAFTLPHCGLKEGQKILYAQCMIFMGWANTAFYWFGNASGSRALSFTDNVQGASNLFGLIGYTAAVIAALVTLYVLGSMARGFFSKKDKP